MNMIKSIIDFNEKKGFICDMDGVIYHGNQILPGVPEEHFYTSALATAAFLKEQTAGCSAFVIGEAGLLNVGITMNDVNPDYVVVGEGRSYSLDTLTKATNLQQTS